MMCGWLWVGLDDQCTPRLLLWIVGKRERERELGIRMMMFRNVWSELFKKRILFLSPIEIQRWSRILIFRSKKIYKSENWKKSRAKSCITLLILDKNYFLFFFGSYYFLSFKWLPFTFLKKLPGKGTSLVIKLWTLLLLLLAAPGSAGVHAVYIFCPVISNPPVCSSVCRFYISVINQGCCCVDDVRIIQVSGKLS